MGTTTVVQTNHAKNKYIHNFSWPRFIIGFAGIVYFCYVLAMSIATGNTFVITVAAIIFTFTLSSLFEWVTHGFLYHVPLPFLKKIQVIHEKGHHWGLFPPTRYIQNETRYDHMSFKQEEGNWKLADNSKDYWFAKGSQIVLHFVIGIPTILLPAWVLTAGNMTFFGTTVVTLGFISYLLASVHGSIHTEKGRWFENHAWFKWLNRHHYIHHIDMTANMNFMLPLCDYVFGSRKAELTKAEADYWPTFDEANKLRAGRA